MPHYATWAGGHAFRSCFGMRGHSSALPHGSPAVLGVGADVALPTTLFSSLSVARLLERSVEMSNANSTWGERSEGVSVGCPAKSGACVRSLRRAGASVFDDQAAGARGELPLRYNLADKRAASAGRRVVTEWQNEGDNI